MFPRLPHKHSKYHPPRGAAPRDLCFGGTSQVKRKSTHGRASEVAKLAFIDGAIFQATILTGVTLRGPYLLALHWCTNCTSSR